MSFNDSNFNSFTKMSNSDDSDSDDQDDTEDKIDNSDQSNYNETVTLPNNSARLYEYQYIKFAEWRSKMKLSNTDENTMLAYFESLSATYKSSTLWSTYSKLRSTILIKEHVDIKYYRELINFLKKKAKNYKAKKARTFTPEEISRFLSEAPNREYLASKVILIMGVFGSLRTREFTNMSINDIKQQGTLYHVTIPVTGASKSFVTSEHVYPLIREYISLRPQVMDTTRFFIHYINGACTRQHIGKNKIASIPQEVATYLKLPHIEEYTGHTFRRTATAIEGIGIERIRFQRYGEWDAQAETNSTSKSVTEKATNPFNLLPIQSVNCDAPIEDGKIKAEIEDNTQVPLYDAWSNQMENMPLVLSMGSPPSDKDARHVSAGVKNEWPGVQESLVYARRLRDEAETATKAAFEKFHRYVDAHGSAAKEEAGLWVLSVADEEEERASLVQLRQRRNLKRDAELLRAREAEKKVERLRAELAAQKRLAKKREEDLQQQLMLAEQDIARVESHTLTLRSEIQQACTVCGTQGVRRDWDCPNMDKHYLLGK